VLEMSFNKSHKPLTYIFGGIHTKTQEEFIRRA